MLVVFLLVFVLFPGSSFAQRYYQIDHIGEQYYAKIYVADTTQYNSDGWIEIYDADTHKSLIKNNTADLRVYWRVKEDEDNLLREAQDLIILADFNFDGILDFAIFNGLKGKYGGKSYDVYIGKKNSTPGTGNSAGQNQWNKMADISFDHDETLTQIIKNSGPVFDLDATSKTITFISRLPLNTYSYLLSTYGYEDNEPFLLSKEEQPFSMIRGGMPR